jgi:hypothetical protein
MYLTATGFDALMAWAQITLLKTAIGHHHVFLLMLAQLGMIVARCMSRVIVVAMSYAPNNLRAKGGVMRKQRVAISLQDLKSKEDHPALGMPTLSCSPSRTKIVTL